MYLRSNDLAAEFRRHADARLNASSMNMGYPPWTSERHNVVADLNVLD